MRAVAVRELKNRLSEYLRQAARGEIILVTDRGRVVAELRRPSTEVVPGSLDVVLDNLEKDHDWLLKGDVFTPDVIETWVDYKRKN